MTHHPYPDVTTPYVIKKVVREPIEVTPPQTAGIKMEKRRSRTYFTGAQLKLYEEIIPKFIGDLVILRQDFIQVRLDSAVKPNLHDS